MPRPRSIKWETRLAIFLDYRRRRKVYPIAKRYGIARSTVSAIVNEFKEMGFAVAPRPSLSSTILAQAQEHHLREVLDGLGAPRTIELTNPVDNVRGRMEPGDALAVEST